MRPLILFLSLITLNILGTPFTFYTSKSGLVHSDVHCVEQGEKFVWIGTSSGINRVLFKGTIPIQFSKRKTSVPVTALEDDGKVVWAGLKGKGVYQMLKENYKLIGFRKDVLGDKEIVNIKRVKKLNKLRIGDIDDYCGEIEKCTNSRTKSAVSGRSSAWFKGREGS